LSSMPQPASSADGQAPAEEVILGVDTHKDAHVAAVLTLVGVVLDSRSFRATAAGYAQLLAWARTFGTPRRAGVGVRFLLSERSIGAHAARANWSL